MFSILERLRRKMFRPVPRPKPRLTPRFLRPRLEALEDRLVLDAMLFIGVGTAAAPAAWGVAANWRDLSGGQAHVPNASDDVGIPAGVGYVSLAPGETAEINSIVTSGATILIIPGGPYAELKIDSNPPASLPAAFPPNPKPGSNYFGGGVSDSGLINANTTDPFTGTNIVFAGGADIGPGDLNGNLVVGPSSSMTFLGTPSIYSPVTVFEAGATLGQGSGNINFDGKVSIMGALDDNTATINIVGGTLGGPGSLDDWANVNWTGGTISLSGGVTVYTTFTANSDSTPLTLLTTLTNEETTDLGGAFGFGLGATGSLVNLAGTMTLSQSIGGSGSITNSALGILDFSSPSSSTIWITTPFTNEGYLNVAAGTPVDLENPGVVGSPSIFELDGTLDLDGNLNLYTTTTSSTGFDLLPGSGTLEVLGGPRSPGVPSLDVLSGASVVIQGNLEVGSASSLAGGGTVYNSGRLQLDTGSSTAGLGAYVQSNSGMLSLVVSSTGAFTPLTVTGTAQLSGTLLLPGYIPEVGDYFTVVTAGSLAGYFDSIPEGMVETDTATSSTITQVD